MHPESSDDFQIAIVCALLLEANAVKNIFDEVYRRHDEVENMYGDQIDNSNTYTTGSIGGQHVVLAYMPGIVKVTSASAAVRNLRLKFTRIKIVLLVGVCSGVPYSAEGTEIILGDILISDRIIEYELGRHYPNGYQRKTDGLDIIERLGLDYGTRNHFHLLKSYDRRRKHVQELTNQYLKAFLALEYNRHYYPGATQDILFHASYRHKHHEQHSLEPALLHIGQHLICTPASASDCQQLGCTGQTLLRSRLRTTDLEISTHIGKIAVVNTPLDSGELRDKMVGQEDIIGVNAAGSGATVWEDLPFIIIQGVCNYSDGHQNRKWQRFAAVSSAFYIKAFLECGRDIVAKEGILNYHRPTTNVPFKEQSLLVGREDVLGIIIDSFQVQSHTRVALVGLEGIGKTHIALEYTARFRMNAPTSWTFWIDASNVVNLKQGYREIATVANVPVYDDPRNRNSFFTQVNSWLSDAQNGHWLMVLDNLDDAFTSPIVSNLLKHVPHISHGSILITSRDWNSARNLVGDDGRIIHVNSMDIHDALALLRTCIPVDESFADDALLLMEVLDTIPRTIIQMASYINTQSPPISISAYWELFQQNEFTQERLLYYDQRANYFQILDKIIQKVSGTVDPLGLISVFDRHEIPKDLLIQDLDQSVFDKAITTLTNFSLIKADFPGGPFQTYRKVQFLIRQWLQQNGYFHDILKKSILIMDKSFPNGDYGTWDSCQVLIPHLKAVTQFTEEGDKDDQLNISGVINRCGWYYYRIGKYQEAENMYRQALASREKILGIQHPDTLACVSVLGLVLQRQGNLEEAENWHQRALACRENLLGREHPDTITSLRNLGMMLASRGKYEAAEAMLRQALDSREKTLGTEHRDTLAVVNDIGIILANLGRNEEAEAMYRRALASKEQILGPVHSDTLGTITSLGLVLSYQKKYTEAESTYQRALTTTEELLGAESPDIPAILNGLGLVLSYQGKFTEAELIYQRALATSEKILGTEHPNTLTSLNNMGLVMASQKKFEEAEAMHRRALEGRESLLGSENPATLMSANDLGSVLSIQGKYLEAALVYRKSLEGCEKMLLRRHPTALASAKKLLWLFEKTGKYQEAESLRRQIYGVISTNSDSRTDSGYSSMRYAEDAKSRSRAYEEVSVTGIISEEAEDYMDIQSDDSRTVYSDAPSLKPAKKRNYIAALADDLFEKINYTQSDEIAAERAIDALPRLLKAFALRVGYNSQDQMHRDVMVFIHKHRADVAQQLRDRYIRGVESASRPQAVDTEKMPLEEVMSRWHESQEHQDVDLSVQGISLEDDNDERCQNDQGADDPDMRSSDGELSDAEGDNVDMPDVLAYRDLVSKTTSYEWLISAFRREITLIPTEPNCMESIRGKIMDSLPRHSRLSRNRSAEAFHMTFHAKWDLLAFINEQMYDAEADEAMEIALTLTGSLNNTQALPCGKYLEQTWPNSGQYILQLLKDVVINEMGAKNRCSLPDDTTLCAWMEGSTFILEVVGIGETIAEIGEQLGWLGASLSSSRQAFGVSHCEPRIIVANSVKHPLPDNSSGSDIVCEFHFYSTEINTRQETSNGQCWHSIFRNPVVVSGYPITRRVDSNTGLEISLHTMAKLVGTNSINIFDGKFFIKGFSAMLVPTRFTGELLIWHFLYSKDGSRISYLDCTVPHAENIKFSDLETTRHIVGWCSQAKYCAGAPDATYSIGRTALPGPPDGGIFENVSIHAGRVIINRFKTGVGLRDTSAQISRHGDVRKLQWLSKKFVVLWDEEDKRGWLVNGTSALLHILRAYLHSAKTGNLKSAFLFKELQEAFMLHTADSAIEVLLDPANRKMRLFPEKESYILLEQQIDYFYDILEKIMDHQVDIAGRSGMNLRSRPRKQLEGWDFKDLSSCGDPIYPRTTRLRGIGKGWVDFTRAIHAIALFGCGFGEIFQPLVDTGLCHDWIQMPKDKYYLAACVSDLRDIMHGDEKSLPVKITEKIIWHNPGRTFEPCECTADVPGKHSDPVQVLLPSKFRKEISKGNSLPLQNSSMLLFGHNSDFKWFWRDIGDPEECSTPPLSEESETDSHDSGIGSSLSNRSLTPTDYTVGIVCALEKELLAVRALFDERHKSTESHPQDTNHYALGCMGQYNVVAACLPSGDYGTNSAAVVATNMGWRFRSIEFYLLVGIGGGVPSDRNDIRLGDIVVSNGVIQYDLGKALQNGEFERTGSVQRTPRSLMTAISILKSDPEPSSDPLENLIKHVGKNRPKYRHPGQEHDKLFQMDSIHDTDQDTCESCNGSVVERAFRDSEHPKIHYGLIASGNQVMRDARTRDLLGNNYGVLCFEMEAAGVFTTTPCLVIRGICDYSDSHKNKLWQEYAAAAAAAYAKLLLTL